LFWLVHPYTPGWLATQVGASAGEIEPIRDGLAGVSAALGARRH
jgi:hypothetical protein